MAKPFFDSIDILRGFAAISVLVYHVIEHFNWSSFPTNGPLSWFRFGWMGVDIFFVISGFVITLSALNQTENSEYDFKIKFLSRRIKRIVPLYYLTSIIFIVFITPQLLFQNFLINIISHIFFFHNMMPDYHGAINGSNWSLGTEMQFYILIALSIIYLKKLKWWHIGIAAILISYCWRFFALIHSNISAPLGVYKLFVMATQLPGMLDEFSVGILLAFLIKSPLWTRLTSFKKTSIFILFFFSLVFVSLTIHLYLAYSSYWDYPYMVIFFRSLMAISIGIVILLLCLINVTPVIKKILYPAYYLGTISYGIYLWHLPILLSVKRIEWLNKQQSFFLITILTVIFASLSWHYFEKNFVKK